MSKILRDSGIARIPWLAFSLGTLVLLLMTGLPLAAVDDGEMVLTVEDTSGNPLPKVEVLITSPDDEKFKKKGKTNKKGMFSVRVFYAKNAYVASFSKEGYRTTEAPLQFKVGGKVRLTVPMAKEGESLPSEKAAQEAAAAQADEVAKLFNEGVAASQEGKAEVAEANFKEVLERAPDLPQAHAALTILYFESDRNEEAAEAVEAWLALEPENGTALRIRYEVQKSIGDEAAIASAREALESADPKVLASSYVEEGRKHFNAGERDQARELLKKALEVDPEAGRAHYLLGLCDLSEEKPTEAKAHLERFLELSPDDPEIETAKELLSMLD